MAAPLHTASACSIGRVAQLLHWQAFLVRWWSEQTPTVKELFHDHVQRGHMEFVNGGYVQHDEAASHYSAMIDQTTLGHMCAFFWSIRDTPGTLLSALRKVVFCTCWARFD